MSSNELNIAWLFIHTATGLIRANVLQKPISIGRNVLQLQKHRKIQNKYNDWVKETCCRKPKQTANTETMHTNSKVMQEKNAVFISLFVSCNLSFLQHIFFFICSMFLLYLLWIFAWLFFKLASLCSCHVCLPIETSFDSNDFAGCLSLSATVQSPSKPQFHSQLTAGDLQPNSRHF